LVLIGVLSSTAAAEPVPVRRVTAGLYFAGGASGIGDVPVGGMGPTAELAVGWGRSQLFVENGAAWMKIGPQTTGTRAFQLRGALGARWIARSLGFDDFGALEMTLEALGGVQRLTWDGGSLVRPEVALGTGVQVRKYSSPHVTVRFGVRVVFTPRAAADESLAMRCTGECTSGGRANTGIMVVVGASL
jgi:hypothetical protein